MPNYRSNIYFPCIALLALTTQIAQAKQEINGEAVVDSIIQQVQQQDRKYGLLKKRHRYTSVETNYSYIGHQIVDSGVAAINTSETQTLTSNITSVFGIRDNVSASFTLPIIYKTSESVGNKKDALGIGDLSGGFSFQPFPSEVNGTTLVVNVSGSLPTGTSPYDGLQSIISTGLGAPSGSLSLNLYKKVNGISFFGTSGITLTLPIDNVDKAVPDTNLKLQKVVPGNIYSICLGGTSKIKDGIFGTLSLQYSYIDKNKYSYLNVVTSETSERESSSKDIGVINFGIRTLINQKIDTDFRIGVGVTPDAPQLSFGVNFPLNI